MGKYCVKLHYICERGHATSDTIAYGLSYCMWEHDLEKNLFAKCQRDCEWDLRDVWRVREER